MSSTPDQPWAERLAVVVAPGPRPDPELDLERLVRHREFYLKSPHTVVTAGSRLRYRPALGALSYRGQLGLLFDATPRHTPQERILDRVRGVVLVAELLSVDLLRVGWEGTMWHVRYGEGASFDDSCVVSPELRDPSGVVGASLRIEDGAGGTDVDWGTVSELCAHVNDWMALRPDMLVLAGSAHGPVLSIDGSDAVVRFPGDEPRLGPGDELVVRCPPFEPLSAVIDGDTDERE